MDESVGRGVGPAAGADLCVDVRDVALDGPHAHEQLFGDLAVGPPAGQAAQHLYLSRRQAVRITGSSYLRWG
jgi:hypothetical protein